MKYLSVIFLVFLCLIGCSKNERGAAPSYFEDNGKIKVLSTTAMIDDLVGEIGGDKIDHVSLIIGELDPHSYELVKGDDEKIAYSNIVIGNGLNLEHGASLNYQLKQHLHAVYLGDEIRKRVPDRILSVDGEIDPHIWMDISLWAEGIDTIVEALTAEDPQNALFYKKNGILLRQEMLKVHQLIRDDLKTIPAEKCYLVTSHDAFHYFARAYLGDGTDWEIRCIAPEGLAPEGQLSTQDIRRVIDHLCRYKINVVFPESNVSRAALKKIQSSCLHDVRISRKPLYGDAMGANGSGADNYLQMIQHNAKVLGEEWKAQSKSIN